MNNTDQDKAYENSVKNKMDEAKMRLSVWLDKGGPIAVASKGSRLSSELLIQECLRKSAPHVTFCGSGATYYKLIRTVAADPSATHIIQTSDAMLKQPSMRRLLHALSVEDLLSGGRTIEGKGLLSTSENLIEMQGKILFVEDTFQRHHLNNLLIGSAYNIDLILDHEEELALIRLQLEQCRHLFPDYVGAMTFLMTQLKQGCDIVDHAFFKHLGRMQVMFPESWQQETQTLLKRDELLCATEKIINAAPKLSAAYLEFRRVTGRSKDEFEALRDRLGIPDTITEEDNDRILTAILQLKNALLQGKARISGHPSFDRDNGREVAFVRPTKGPEFGYFSPTATVAFLNTEISHLGIQINSRSLARVLYNKGIIVAHDPGRLSKSTYFMGRARKCWVFNLRKLFELEAQDNEAHQTLPSESRLPTE